jgi:hypothetical protein
MRFAFVTIAIAIAMIFNISFNSFPPVIYEEKAQAQAGCMAVANPALGVTLTWTDQSNNEDGFRIERKLNAGNYSPLGTPTGPNVQTSKDTNLVRGAIDNVYTYRVFAFNSAGDGGPSNEACAIVAKLVTPPAAATGLVLQ